MKVKLLLPALTEATSPFWRPIKYSLFPPLGLATLAGYLDDSDEVVLQDEHVERLELDDEPDLVVLEVYVTSARRAYELADHYRARGAHVCLGGIHVTALPEEAVAHADTVFMGPGEDTWPTFLSDYRRGRPKQLYQSRRPSLLGAPPARRDLIRRQLYLAPNSLVVSRGCPRGCDFCYTSSFLRGCTPFFTESVDQALAQIEALPGRHLFFLDDDLFANPRFAAALFDGMRGMGRVWQSAGTVAAVLRPGLLERAVESGLRSLFIGLETLSAENLRAQHKRHNLVGTYGAALRRLHDLGVMVNASFVFGMDDDRPDVFDRTVEWALAQGIETATFHVLTPYPGTTLYERLARQGRILTRDWDRYDTRHAVFQPAAMTPAQLEDGYRRAYRDFYAWGSILRSAGAHATFRARARHLAYAGGWKKCEPLWDAIIRTRRVASCLPLLEAVLGWTGPRRAGERPAVEVPDGDSRRPDARGLSDGARA